jgi:hypothetical protein
MKTSTAIRRVRTKAARPSRGRLRPLREVFDEHDAIIQRGDYEIVGRLECVIFAGKLIEFVGRKRPVIGMATGGTAAPGCVLLWLSDFSGWPDLLKRLEKFCPTCAVPCERCKEEGKHLCTGTGCGGRGYIELGKYPCGCGGQRDCKACGGRGQIVNGKADCKACKGTKLQTCTGCLGTLLAPTGMVDGATCPACDGTRIATERTPQVFEPSELEGFEVYGPLVAFELEADRERTDAGKNLRIVFGQDDRGNLGALFADGSKRLWVHGGIPKEVLWQSSSAPGS